jgi:expansin (peptidoglycan-binding protein)
MIELQYFDGEEWIPVATWQHEWMAWASLGGDDYNYRTLDADGKVLTDKSDKDTDHTITEN